MSFFPELDFVWTHFGVVFFLSRSHVFLVRDLAQPLLFEVVAVNAAVSACETLGDCLIVLHAQLCSTHLLPFVTV